MLTSTIPSGRATYRRLLADDAPSYADLSPAEQRLARMLFFSLWPGGSNHESIKAGLARLHREEAARDEMRAVIDLAFDEARHVTIGLDASLRHVPLQVHARYQREEVLAALDYASLIESPTPFAKESFTCPS